jgi:hypothetical protein
MGEGESSLMLEMVDEEVGTETDFIKEYIKHLESSHREDSPKVEKQAD